MIWNSVYVRSKVKRNCLQLTFSSRFIYIGNKQARKHHAGLQIMTCRWLKHRYLPYTHVSPEKKIKSGEGGRGSYQSCVGQKQVRTSVLLSFKKIMKKETLNPRFFSCQLQKGLHSSLSRQLTLYVYCKKKYVCF